MAHTLCKKKLLHGLLHNTTVAHRSLTGSLLPLGAHRAGFWGTRGVGGWQVVKQEPVPVGTPLLPQRAPGGQRAYLVGRGAVVVVGSWCPH